MPLGMEVGLGQGDFVLDGDPAPPLQKRAEPPQFSAHVFCGQTAAWIKIKLRTEVDIGPGHILLDGDPAPLSKRRRAHPPIFGPCLMWPNGYMDQDETWHGGRPQPWPHCVRCGPSYPAPKGHSPLPIFARVCCGQTTGWIKLALGMEVGHIVLDGDPAPLYKKGTEPPIFGPCVLRPYGWMDQDAAWYEGRPRPRRHSVIWGHGNPAPPPQKGAQPPPPIFDSSILPNGCVYQDTT